MTTIEPMTDGEARLREALRRELVAPPTPASLRASVDAMATAHLAAPAGRRGESWLEALTMGLRGMRVAGGIAVVVVLVGLAVLAIAFRTREEVAAPSVPVPTLPAVTWPALPSPPATPTRLAYAEWIDADTVLAMPRDRATFRFSTDGGQTWGDERALPDHALDLGFGFTDAQHGYSMWMTGDEDQAQVLRVDLTDDGGRTWRQVTAGELPASNADALGNVHFSDAQHGVALGTLRARSTGNAYGQPVRCSGWATADGGATWTETVGAPCLWGGINWPTPTLGYLLLLGGETWLTTDGGLTWTHGQLPDQGADIEIWPKTAVQTTAGVRLIGGTLRTDGDTAPPLVVWDSEDGGATWRESMRDPAIRMTAVEVTAFGADHWLSMEGDGSVKGSGSVFRETIDAGRTWSEVGRVDLSTWGGVAWTDRLHGAMQGYRMPATGGKGYITVWLTNDGGRTWVEAAF